MAVKLDYAVQESVTNIRRNPFMSFAAVSVVSVSLFLLGGSFLLRSAVGRAADIITQQVRVTVFLTPDISPQDREQIEADLRAMPEVASVNYESKQQAYETFKEVFKDQPALVENTRPDALPESFRVELIDPEQFDVISARLTGRPGVDIVRDERETVRKLFDSTRTIRRERLITAVINGLAALVLIATTIRMALFARRREIGIMKLVGATNWFIRVPFMLEGMAQGMLGGALASIALLLVRPWLSSVATPFGRLGDFNVSVTYMDVAQWSIWLVLAGVIIGGVGSLFGLRKFLDV